MAIYGSRRHRICHPKLMANQSRNGVIATPSMMLYTVKESMIPLSPVARLTVACECLVGIYILIISDNNGCGLCGPTIINVW